MIIVMDDFVTRETPLNRESMEILVLPIIKMLSFDDGTEEHKIVGTGFFIADRLFLTAKHVFFGRGAALDREGAPRMAVYCIHAWNTRREFVARPIDVNSLRTRTNEDIVIGHVEARQFFTSDAPLPERVLRHTGYIAKVTSEPIPVGTRILTVAYPLATARMTAPGQFAVHIQSDAYEGHVAAHHPEGRDR
jgi:hypothetical protein